MTNGYGAVTSEDGTRIGYEIVGKGPRIVAIHGGTADRSRWAVVAPQLARRHEVWLVDRRGRGLSGDAEAYALSREVEDLRALVEAAGPGVVLLGHSYGATCALGAAGGLPGLAGMVLYEPAFETPGHTIIDEESFAEVERLLVADDRDAALTLFCRRVIGLSEQMVDAMRPTPIWAARLKAAHTLPREGRAAQAFRPDPTVLASLPFPVVVLRGTESPEWLRSSSAAVHAAIPGSALVELPGQAHMAMDTAPELFVREVLGFARRVAAVPVVEA